MRMIIDSTPLKDIDQVQLILDKNDKAIAKILILKEHLEHDTEQKEQLERRIKLLTRCISRRLRRAATWVDLTSGQKGSTQRRSQIMLQTRYARQAREKELRSLGQKMVVEPQTDTNPYMPLMPTNQNATVTRRSATGALPRPSVREARAVDPLPYSEKRMNAERLRAQGIRPQDGIGSGRGRKPGDPLPSSQFTGVYHDARNRWIAQFTYRSKQYYLGRYDTEENAARIYKKAWKHLRRFNRLILPRINRASEVVDFSTDPPGKTLVDGANYDDISSASEAEDEPQGQEHRPKKGQVRVSQDGTSKFIAVNAEARRIEQNPAEQMPVQSRSPLEVPQILSQMSQVTGQQQAQPKPEITFGDKAAVNPSGGSGLHQQVSAMSKPVATSLQPPPQPHSLLPLVPSSLPAAPPHPPAPPRPPSSSQPHSLLPLASSSAPAAAPTQPPVPPRLPSSQASHTAAAVAMAQAQMAQAKAHVQAQAKSHPQGPSPTSHHFLQAQLQRFHQQQHKDQLKEKQLQQQKELQQNSQMTGFDANAFLRKRAAEATMMPKLQPSTPSGTLQLPPNPNAARSTSQQLQHTQFLKQFQLQQQQRAHLQQMQRQRFQMTKQDQQQLQQQQQQQAWRFTASSATEERILSAQSHLQSQPSSPHTLNPSAEPTTSLFSMLTQRMEEQRKLSTVPTQPQASLFGGPGRPLAPALALPGAQKPLVPGLGGNAAPNQPSSLPSSALAGSVTTGGVGAVMGRHPFGGAVGASPPQPQSMLSSFSDSLQPSQEQAKQVGPVQNLLDLQAKEFNNLFEDKPKFSQS